ncbi:uncharacterized protein FSUBG_1102 [Fusarium subglutinans]|uniref:Aminoglycoside phosphotransferase domain-containing protein n=1 Tax=Gibberella subglutinans TaxID=42677 RepID=A0A8H5V6H3_GIBSU|nr:uncharacterized protein FSUBG_1102 [Fusarium subglutinans]KAF5612872.1 hypothetical protein FSUBG_1102 [Fusarium subglutinans]
MSNSTAFSIAYTKAQQSFDRRASALDEEAWQKSERRLYIQRTCHKVMSFVEGVCEQTASLVPPVILGRCNIIYRFHCDGDAYDIVVRQPRPEMAHFRKEKALYEAATISYLSQNSSVHVPDLFFHTPSSYIGPAMILLFVKSERSMSEALTSPGQDLGEIPVLDPEISEEDLRTLYRKTAGLLIKLFEPTRHKIGSLVEVGTKHSVARRPLTQNMNDLVCKASVPESVLPSPKQVYTSADEWYAASAAMHMAQLLFQHDDIVGSEDEYRNKYVARYLFHLLAKKGQLSAFGFLEDNWSVQSQFLELSCPMPYGLDSFRLWCDNLRPHNILLNEHDHIVAALDWEFAYFAPTQFSLDPPWWLLLQLPELWPSGIDDWSQVYETRLRTWLLAIQDEERGEGINFPENLSGYMRESWLSGRFWLTYATRKSWAFDTIFWKYLDERFFGPRDENIQESQFWTARVHLLGEEAQRSMEMVVERKMNDAEEGVPVDWDPDTANQLLQEALGDDSDSQS